METQTREERIEAIKARLREFWPGAYGDYSAKTPNGDGFGGDTWLGWEAFVRFAGDVLKEFDLGDADTKHFDDFRSGDTLAVWIVEEQDRKTRRPTPVSS